MQMTIIAVGKLKEKYLREGIAEYEKRLKPYARVRIIEVGDEKEPDAWRENETELVKQKEGERILQQIKPGHYVVALAIEGKMWSSEQFAQELHRLGLRGKSQIAFVIGGSLGLSKEVLQRADVRLSFSKMTFPHQLMRLILLEQVYRACRIIAGHPYHK
ncbi:23S rRNA (pseudouridine(1915)-N(3))-methyltransferase RlmH [Bacillaceae bacterium]